MLLVWALVLTESNGGVLALGLGISFLVMVRHYRRHGWAGALATGLVIGLVAGTFFTVLPLNSIRQWALYSGQPLLVNSIGRSGQSSNERGLLIQETIQLYQASHGVTGLGPASTKPLLTTGLYPYANEAHNDWLAALVERGVLGLGALLLLAGCVIARAGPAVRRPLSAPMAAAVPAPAGIVAAVLAVSINSFYEEVLHFRPLWMLFGIAAVLGRDALRVNKASRQRRFARLRPAALTRMITRPPAKVKDSNGQDGHVRRPLMPLPAAIAASAGASRQSVPAAVMARLPAPVRALIPAPAGKSGSKGVSKNVITNLGAQGGALACVVDRQPAGRPGRRPDRTGLLVAAARAAVAVRRRDLLRPADRLGLLPGRRARQGPAGPAHPRPCMAVIGAGVSALAWLACAVPFHDVFFKQMPLRPRGGHDHLRHHLAVERHGQGLLPGLRRHPRRQPAHRGRGVLVPPGLCRPQDCHRARRIDPGRRLDDHLRRPVLRHRGPAAVVARVLLRTGGGRRSGWPGGSSRSGLAGSWGTCCG